MKKTKHPSKKKKKVNNLQTKNASLVQPGPRRSKFHREAQVQILYEATLFN